MCGSHQAIPEEKRIGNLAFGVNFLAIVILSLAFGVNFLAIHSFYQKVYLDLKLK